MLPDLRPVRVRVSPSVRAWLAPLIDADPGLVEAAESADVECRSSASSQGIAADSGGMPLLAITARPRALVTISAPAGEASRLARLISELGIERGLTSELAEAAVPLVAIEAPPTPTDRRVRIWEALLDDRADLVHSRAFPLLLASSLRWLAGRGEYAPRVAVREALAESIPAAASARVAPEGSCCDPVGRPYVPLVAGVHGDAHGGAVAAALLDSRPTWPEGGPAGVRFAASAADLGGMVDLRIPLALLALALLLVEWLLVRSGRIP